MTESKPVRPGVVADPAEELFFFGPFSLAPATRSLRIGDKEVQLGGRAFDLLVWLVRNAGQVVSKRTLMAAVWRDVSVGEESLRAHVSLLRRALGDGRDGSRFVVNVPGQGYSFVAPVASQVSRRADSGAAAVIGRDGIVEEVCRNLRGTLLQTLVGPGGIGKTTVAREVVRVGGHQFRDGVAWADLSSTSTDDLVAPEVSIALGVPSSTSPISDICAFLSSRHQLLVLDCCERALLGVASLVEALNKSAPGVSILATSREALHAVGERTTQLPPLEMPSFQNGLELDVALEHAAIRLFVLRATAAGSDFRATDADVAAIVDLCRRLDGLPLAIELAAVHTLAFSVHELTTLLDSRFQLAGIGRRTGEPRHQTLQATLDWSYDLLAEQDRKVLCRLSVFEGSATLEAILAVVSDGDLSRTSVAESLARLSEKSLLKREVIDGSVHRRLLDTTRAYAAGRLQASGDEGSCRRRLAQFLAAEVTRSQIEGEHLSAVAWFGPACPNLGNLRAAFRWAANSPDDQLLAVALACAALPILMQLSRLEECQRWSEQALLLIDQGGLPDPRRIMLLAFRGTAMLGTQGPVDASLAAIELALESAEREGDAGFQALTLSGLYWLRMYRGESNAAIECAQGLGDLAPADDAAQRVRDHYVAMATCIAGRQSAASLLFDAIDSAPALVDLGRFMRIGSNPSVLTKAFQVKTLWLTGRSTAAMELYNHCEPILREPEHGLYLCLALNEVMIPFFCFHADWDRAESAVAELLEHSDRQMMAIRRRSGEAAAEAVALLQGKGDLDKYFSALQDLRRARFSVLMPWYDDVLGRALVARGEPAKAAAILDDAATLCARSGNGWWLPAVFTSRAYAASAMGEPFENFDFAAATLAREQGASAFTGGSKPAT